MEPHPFMNLGGKEMLPDARDFKLSTDLGSATQTPEVYMPESFFKRKRVFYQRDIPDCGANLGAFLAAYLDENPEQEYSPDYQWIDIKTFDGFPLADGTDMRSIFKSITKGSIPYAMLPEKTTLPLDQFSSTKRLTLDMKKEAVKHKIAAYGFHNEPLTMQALKDLIYKHKAVAVLVRIGNEFWTDKKGKSSWAEKDILPLRTPKAVVSGHFIVLGAFDKDNIYFANWWSKEWGRKGYGYFRENYLPQITNVGTIVDDVTQVIVPVFARDLYLGITGDDVKQLQRYLNSHGFKVADSGLGSPGKESTYFGDRTQKALIAFQKANGIIPASGYFGPITRRKIESLGGVDSGSTGAENELPLTDMQEPSPQFGFLKSTRFWAIVLGAVGAYARVKGFIGDAEITLIGTIAAGFVTVRTVDRIGDKKVEAAAISAEI